MKHTTLNAVQIIIRIIAFVTAIVGAVKTFDAINADTNLTLPLMVIASSVFIFAFAELIVLLMQIEKNTRPESEHADPNFIDVSKQDSLNSKIATWMTENPGKTQEDYFKEN
jgi:hypothetical protein